MKTLRRLLACLCLLAAPAHAAPGDVDSLDAAISKGGYQVSVYATAVQPDGKVVIGGDFTSVLGQPRNNIARLNADGTLDAGFNPNVNGQVNSVAVQADGKILLGGQFSQLGGAGRGSLARVAANGTLDAGFNPNVNGTVCTTLVQPDGKILLGGRFGFVGGTSRSEIARVAADGTLDPGFNPIPGGGTLSRAPIIVNGEEPPYPGVYTLAAQADGKILIGGNFETVNGVGRSGIARVAANGDLDAAFNPGAAGEYYSEGGPAYVHNAQVYSVVVQADGKILLGGRFTAVGGAGRSGIARVAADGAVDPNFNPNAASSVSGLVRSVAAQADGKMVFAGDFTFVAGTVRNRVARVAATGALDAGFDPNCPAAVQSVAPQGDGRVFVAGSFSSVGGSARNGIARLLNDPATQSLTAPTTARVLWSRGGSAPEVSQVTFELSTNGGASYTALPGAAARVGTTANWQLTGLSLPASGHLRARGRTSGGRYNGSSGLVETVASFGGALTVIEAWRQTRFGTTANAGAAADLADPDNDGLANLVEFAFGLNPAQSSIGQAPVPAVTAGAAVYSFVQPAGVAGVTYRAEWSETLAPGSWTVMPDTGVAPQHVFSVATAGRGKVFTRLVVTTAP